MGESLEKGCVACRWTLDKERRCHYTSHLKLLYGASTWGVWSIGSDVVLKDRPDEGPKAKIEVKTLDYLGSNKNSDIPIPKVLRDWVDRDGRYFILNERISGQTLEEGIDFSVRNLKNRYCRLSCFLFFDLEPRGPFHSDQELWNTLALNLRYLPQNVLENLKKRQTKCESYVLTHCNLNLGNIMVQDGKVVGILDWEYAAFFPIWHEYVSASFGLKEMDVEWKRLLRERLDAHGEAHENSKAFWTDMCNSRPYPNLDEKGQEALDRLL
ncbi:hypothetical protein N7509_010014 [Penicillium cosmopolitanum]|uniref:Aminoglycoside phosphotransferase domain-containing protein n=1 Tax=Penicillium cosmopolitanum TaxID=1131564 RepID=A0A9W9VQH7_9EURO|nr:uncharacterized protein N7509_010014 [Penicillium cosmopolitanum]KAJ5387473.1 hypothetical protein N7509_010014 [Penicillium cosmopolitanum]